MKNSKLNQLIESRVGSKLALLRAMQRSNTPIVRKTLYNWMHDSGSIKVSQLVNLAKALDMPVTELVEHITIKHEGDE